MPSRYLRLAAASLAFATALLCTSRYVLNSRSAPNSQIPSAVSAAALSGAANSSANAPAASATDPAACLPTQGDPGAKFAEAVAARARRDEALARAAAFQDWLTLWRRTDTISNPTANTTANENAPAQSAVTALAARGRELATARRSGIKYLIETDPRRALDLAVPAGLRAELPAEVQDQLERHFDQRGDLEVSIQHVGAEARTDRVARLDDTSYRAFVFGRRETQATKLGLPLHGIAVDDAVALEEAPFRALDDGEKAAHGLDPHQIALRIGTKITVVADAAELKRVTERLVYAESAMGPQVLDARSGSPDDPNTPATAAVTSPASWINGSKRVLWLKIDFADDPGAAFTDAEIQAGAAATNDYYVANSQNKTTFTATILPAVLRMPKDKAYYNTSGSTNGELYTAARDAAKAYDAANGNAGAWDPDKFDRYIIVHKRFAVYLYGGVAQLGGPRVGLNNTVAAGTAGHELGHTQSLAHSHYWLPSGTSAVGAGTHIEYGDVFDIMGGGGAVQHFNVSQKYKLGYLDNTSITTITQAGTYRINRHDDKDAAGIRGLRIAPADLGYEYWVEHRRVAPTNFNAAQTDRLRNGVLIHWGAEKSPKFTTGQGTYLLDGTPGSAGGANDAPVRTGESFVDPDAGITIKPLATGGAAPNEYIDVQVSFGAIDGNRNPTLAADAPAGPILARSNVVFTASGSDPDGDSIYYRWDFGDGSLQPNLGSVTRRFPKGGDYNVRVSAHDGKGGIAAKTIPIRVVDPLVSWTQRASGLTPNALNDVIYAGGKFVAVGINQTIVTSPDGVTWTRVTFPTGNSLTGVAYNGARYVVSGYRFNNATQKGLAAYSDDGGATWTLVNIDTGLAQFWGLAYGAGRFVAVGDSGIVYSSTNGATWTASPIGVTTALRAVTFADGLFVITGDNGRLFTSTDGVSWVNRSLPTTASFWGSGKHDGTWYTRSGTVTYSSPDGATWTRVTSSNATNLGSYKTQSIGGVLMVGLTAGTIDFGESAQSWSSVQLTTATGAGCRSTAASDRTIVSVGNSGLIYTTDVPASGGRALPPPSLRLEADSLKAAVGKKNVFAASGSGFVKLELYANGAKVSEINGSAGALSWTPTTIGNYLLTVRGVDATGASVVSASYPAVSGFANWKWRNPSPVGADLHGAVRVDGKWWIVGGGGTLLTLDDAGNFTPIDFSTTQVLNAIAYANGRFVIGTTDLDGATKEDIGGIWTSPDGYSWTPFLTGVLDSANINSVIYAADRWIAVGGGGVIVTSTDGINWPRASSGTTQTLLGAAAGNGIIVAVATGGVVVTSADGQAWTSRTSGVTTDLRSVTFANGMFVAVGLNGTILTSTNGTAWTRATSGTTTNLYGVSFVKGAFVAGGDAGTLLSSTNGTTWTTASLGGNGAGTFSIAGSGDDGLLMGRNGEVYTPTSSAAWRRVTQGTGDPRLAVVYGGGRFVAVGQVNDGISRGTVTPVSFSTDGVNWTRAAANPIFNVSNLALNTIAYGNQTYVTFSSAGRIFTSPDANAWTQRTSVVNTAINGLTYGANGFVAAGTSGVILTSADGAAWTSRPSGRTQALRAAAFGSGRYVVVGDGGTIINSTDGVSWTAATLGTTANLLAVGWWEDVGFIAAGASGTMVGSIDGVTWQQLETGVADAIGAIVKTPIGYVAPAGTQGTMLVSLDGISWSLSAAPVDKTVRGLAASPTALVAVGDGAVVLTFEFADSTPAPTIAAQPTSRAGVPGEAVRFTVSAQNAAGAVYQWSKDGTPILGANSPVYTIPVSTNTNAGAYTVSVTTPTGTVTSSAANLAFPAIADPGRLINLSIRTSLDSATDDFTFGVVVGGNGAIGGKALLVRAVGPSLFPFGVSDALQDPKLEFYTGTAKVGENDNWGGSPAISAAMAQVGAFPFTSATSRDAVISLPSLAIGQNSAKIFGTGAGTVLAELYDATPTNAFTIATPRLINVSVLKHIGKGVTAGFVIGGSSSRKVLIRAIGPTLGGFGVSGAVADPQLALYRGETQLNTNDNWGGGAALSAAFSQVGAFGLDAASKDAALIADLQPGNYTVQVSGVGDTTGVALVEIYELP